MLKNEKLTSTIIWITAIVIPIVVGILTNPAFPKFNVGFDTHIFATFSAGINFTVTLLLIIGYILIRNGQERLHEKAMLSAFILSIVFLFSYIFYHSTSPTTYHCAESPVSKTVYLLILYSHIGLSAIIVPLSCFTVFRGLTNNLEKHRKIAKITLPLWLYVTITGVIVYLMISPCYH